MATLLIGDFRSLSLQHYQNTAGIENAYVYLIENTAECSWFTTSAVSQLPLMSLNQTNVVIMLGFIDCVYSCVWKVFDIDKIVENYTNTINDMIEQYPDLQFSVCSVCPIETDYPFSEYPGGVIPKKILTKKIEK